MTPKINFKKISKFSGPKRSPGYLLWRISTQWRSCIEQALKQLGLTHAQFVVLATTGWLTKDGSQTTQIEIGKSAGLDPNNTSQIIRLLEEKNLIQRTRTIDERSKNPELTELGKKLLGQALPLVETEDQRFFDALSELEVETFIKLCTKLMSQK